MQFLHDSVCWYALEKSHYHRNRNSRYMRRCRRVDVEEPCIVMSHKRHFVSLLCLKIHNRHNLYNTVRSVRFSSQRRIQPSSKEGRSAGHSSTALIKIIIPVV